MRSIRASMRSSVSAGRPKSACACRRSWDRSEPPATAKKVMHKMWAVDMLGDYEPPKNMEPLFMQLSKKLAQGILDDDLLNHQQLGGNVEGLLNKYALAAERCFDCNKYHFASNGKSVYCGMKIVCPKCLTNYVSCPECDTFILKTDCEYHVHLTKLKDYPNGLKKYNATLDKIVTFRMPGR